MNIYHLNCLKIVSPINDNVIGHCLLLEDGDNLVLIDAGIGLMDTQKPLERIGKELIDLAGFKFSEAWTAHRQIQLRGLNPNNVTDIVLSHLDPDHIGGLADFPNARVHVGVEEFENFNSGNPRYLVHQLSHTPPIQLYGKTNYMWYGFEARKVNVGINAELYLIPLFGHTLGHCGVAIKTEQNWMLYVGDAYYMKLELVDSQHPVNELAKVRADNNEQRLETLGRIGSFVKQHPNIMMFGYHDSTEFNPTIDA